MGWCPMNENQGNVNKMKFNVVTQSYFTDGTCIGNVHEIGNLTGFLTFYQFPFQRHLYISKTCQSSELLGL